MITHLYGDLFQSLANVLVNTLGVTGKVIALKSERICSEMFEAYRNHRNHRERRDLQIGQRFLYWTQNKWILNFPKKHWRNPAREEYIESGLKTLGGAVRGLG